MTRTHPIARVLALTATVAALAACAAWLLTGCGTPGEAHSAGPAPTASAPVRLWPGQKSATTPPVEPGPQAGERVPGIPARPDGNIHALSALDIVRAEIEARPHTYSGADGMDDDTARKILACTEPGPNCPLRVPQYHDLTGNGRDDLVVGFDMAEGSVGLRAYTLDAEGHLIRILATSDVPFSVEVAGRELIVRSPAQLAGYETRYVWAWDAALHSMRLARQEIRKIHPTPADRSS
ncbi:hypothetical protein ACIQU6_29765 [Streptomyces sp. NPDC090442]|uniref:hypothetical protein n=1 Tax=Streptomyces sp. NPDC090442 TaxID=3365962 RepID=UPI00382A5E99